MRAFPRCLTVLTVIVGAFAASLSAQAPIRGFPADALEGRGELEALLTATPDSARLREYMLVMSEEPHHGGSPGTRAVAEYALGKFLEWGLDARIEEFEALMPFPTERLVEMVGPSNYVLRLAEPEIAEDKDSGDEGQLPTYNAYSADGDVTAELVFVNYGLPEDYERLAEMGIDVEGKIVIAKYGRSWRGIKPKVAAENGAIACIIYSDPEDDGYYREDVYPVGPMRPEFGAQRGSVMDMPTHTGDPLSPGWGSVEGSRRLERSEATTIMTIPVLPISYGDALPLLRALGGPVAPNDDWKGALPITYHVGPGPATVHVKLEFDWSTRTLYNVVVRIPGTTDAEQLVIHGNHHDAWVNGAGDPISGAVALMETARSFSELLKTGWQPRRTLMFALWDGEEWGLLGSTEWAEHNGEQLQANGVVYFNSDSNSRGWFGAAGSHSLQTFVEQVARDITDPRTGLSALEASRQRSLDNADTEADSTRIVERGYRIGALGSGSDYTAFIDHLNMAALNLGHGGAQPAGVYHSIYDSYDFYTRFNDPGFQYGQAQAGAFGIALSRMVDAPILPFSFSDAASTYAEYVEQLQELAEEELGDEAISVEAVSDAVARLASAGDAFDAAVSHALDRGSAWLESNQAQLNDINEQIFLTERDLRTSEGLPRRPWFRHSIYAPGFYTGYGVKTMPGVREALELGNATEAAAQATIVAAAVNRMAQRVERIVEALNAL